MKVNFPIDQPLYGLDVIAIVEIPAGSKHKYEIDKQTGVLMLDRVLTKNYPANYGYIGGTLSEDGDPLDVFIMSDELIMPLTVVRLEVMGVIHMRDKGVMDEKIIARIKGSDLVSIHDVIAIEDFLKTYKTDTELLKTEYSQEAGYKVINESIRRYDDRLS